MYRNNTERRKECRYWRWLYNYESSLYHSLII